MDRKPITKTERFEVFKRDKFACQYCGAAAPAVVLHVDHIYPVSKGGDNDITNLITACSDCNAGKGARLLSDDSAVAKRKRQLDELQERREQIEMMVEWQRSLMGLDDEATEKAKDFWQELAVGYSLNESGVKKLGAWVQRYGFAEVLESIRTAAKTYLKTDPAGQFTQESVNKAFDYIPRICANRGRFAEKPYLRELYYIRGIMKNRLHYLNEWKAIELMESAYKNGAELEEIKQVALDAKNWTQWNEMIARLATGSGENGSNDGNKADNPDG